MKKLIFIILSLCIVSCVCYAQAFNGFVWVDMNMDTRINYVIAITIAANELNEQAGLSAEQKKVCDTISRGLEDKTPEDIVAFINSYYATRDDLYIPIVEVLYLYAKAFVGYSL